jgi:aryl-alcohol dehydrogenase-like predicted oxidoreductase
MNAFLAEKLDDALLARVQALLPIAAELGATASQLALAWVLRRPEVSSAIIGATRPAQVVENAAASGLRLDPATVARIEAALAG